MSLEPIDFLELNEGKKLYDYQLEAIERIFTRLRTFPEKYNLCFQLPTGGGKTVIFSEIARRYIKETGKKVLILTHRIELLGQTHRLLLEAGVKSKIIVSKVKELEQSEQAQYHCFIAMVETLNNRLKDEKFEIENVGLVIVDEAHYNSFRKLFKWFEDNIILGVTATPLSSNITLPLHKEYNELIVGDSIKSLVAKGFLAKATTYTYDVSLHSLKVGIHGDYTVSSSELLYGNVLMQEKLIYAYKQKALGKKTLIFNNGINTSKLVYQLFSDAGIDIRHLDNTHTETERREILQWFRQKPDAVLTSVSILTTGFDEPSVEAIILNRATKSLTLYHQMIGRGSRVIGNKKEFTVIDLGNNAHRFGLWDSDIDWQDIFAHPDNYIESIASDEQLERNLKYEMPPELRQRFAKSIEVAFDVQLEYTRIMRNGGRVKDVLENSIQQHLKMIRENATDVYEALELAQLLLDDVRSRVKQYSYCIARSTESYLQWMRDEYMRKLQLEVRKSFV